MNIACEPLSIPAKSFELKDISRPQIGVMKKELKPSDPIINCYRASSLDCPIMYCRSVDFNGNCLLKHEGFLMYQNQKRLHFGYISQKISLPSRKAQRCNLLILLVPRAGLEPARWSPTEGF